MIIQNIQSLEEFIGTLFESIDLKNNNEILLSQSKAVKEIEQKLNELFKE